jgi:hypothetical protein
MGFEAKSTDDAIRGVYEVEDGFLVLYRSVCQAEFDRWSDTGRLEAQEGGMAFGKHFTCSEKLARAWAARFEAEGWWTEPGRVLVVRIAYALVEQLEFDPRADSIGPQCFVPHAALVSALIQEVQ